MLAGMVEMIGTGAAVAMVTFYALEDRGPIFILLFAASCAVAAGYALAIGSYPFFGTETVWTVVALRRGIQRMSAARPATE